LGAEAAQLFVDLARDHLVPEPGHDLRQQLEPRPLLVRDQDTQMPGLGLSHRQRNEARRRLG
jgi:hypothetical protein